MFSLPPKLLRHIATHQALGRNRRGSPVSPVVQPLEARSLMSHLAPIPMSVRPTDMALPTVEVQHFHRGAGGYGHHTRYQAPTVVWNTLSPNPAIAISSQNNGATPSQAADDFFFTSATASAFSLREIKIDGLFTNPRARITDVNVQLYQTYPFWAEWKWENYFCSVLSYTNTQTNKLPEPRYHRFWRLASLLTGCCVSSGAHFFI